jgi:ferritin-like protein
MAETLSERELIKLQIQAYDFYAGLIDRAVISGAHEAKMPKWDEQRAVEYRNLADQLRQRLEELEAADPQVLNAPGTTP